MRWKVKQTCLKFPGVDARRGERNEAQEIGARGAAPRVRVPALEGEEAARPRVFVRVRAERLAAQPQRAQQPVEEARARGEGSAEAEEPCRAGRGVSGVSFKRGWGREQGSKGAQWGSKDGVREGRAVEGVQSERFEGPSVQDVRLRRLPERLRREAEEPRGLRPFGLRWRLRVGTGLMQVRLTKNAP